jgi:hypothetical protein
MSFRTQQGNEFKMEDLGPESIKLNTELADNMMIHDLDKLKGRDYTEEEERKVTEQVQAMTVPFKNQPAICKVLWAPFAAHHLPAVVNALRTLDQRTQKKAYSSIVHVFSLMTDPKDEPYFRKFLASSFCAGTPSLPTLVASAFLKPLTFKRPGGPFAICTLLIHFLFWCPTELGDDKKACIDADVRKKLAARVKSLSAGHNLEALVQSEGPQAVDMEQLLGILMSIENIPGPDGFYLKSTQQHLQGQVGMCMRADESCDEDATMQCSRCKVYRYCGKECQTWDWKHGGHKGECFKNEY